MIEFLKESVRPSSVVGLLVLATPGVALLYVSPLARWGRRWLSLLMVGYWMLTAPVSVRLLTRTLTGGYTRVEASQVRDAQAIVVLSAGSLDFRDDGRRLSVVASSSAWRVLEAARVYHMAATPLVIASGGITSRDQRAAPESEALRQALIQLAVPPDRIIAESTSKNTRDEAAIVSEMLRARGITRVAMVTSPTHMRRSMVLFAQQGLNPVPAIAPLAADHGDAGAGVLPTATAALLGDAVVYEWAARGYYWWHGWLS